MRQMTYREAVRAALRDALPSDPRVFLLDAPVARVCGAEVPIPYAPHLEDAALPQVETILSTVREMLPSSAG